MKKILFFSLWLVIASCKTKRNSVGSVENVKESMEIRTVEKAEVASLKYNRAFDLGNRLLETCNTSKFKVFSKNEATDKVISNATPEKVAAICKKINHRNGKYLGMELIDITFDPTKDEYIFRYLINYQKKLFKRELYVTLDSDSKVSAITTKEINQKPF